MTHRIVFAPEAREDFDMLPAYARAMVRDHIDRHLAHAPTAVSRSRIKRLREMEKPQYRLRVEDIRIFYDVRGDEVEVLGIVGKPSAAEWLEKRGIRS